MRYQYRDTTKTGALIGTGTPNPTTLATANENRKRLGLPPYSPKPPSTLENIISGWKLAIKDVSFLDSLLYVIVPILALCFSIIIFLELNKELWKC